MSEIVNRAFRWGLLGLLVGPATVYSIMLLALYQDEGCASGGVCQLDIGINLILGVIFGFLLFFVVALVRGIRRRRRDEAGPG